MPGCHTNLDNSRARACCDGNGIAITVDTTHQPVIFFHLHAGIADYFHHGGQGYQNFVLQPTKGITSAVNL